MITHHESKIPKKETCWNNSTGMVRMIINVHSSLIICCVKDVAVQPSSLLYLHHCQRKYTFTGKTSWNKSTDWVRKSISILSILIIFFVEDAAVRPISLLYLYHCQMNVHLLERQLEQVNRPSKVRIPLLHHLPLQILLS